MGRKSNELVIKLENEEIKPNLRKKSSETSLVKLILNDDFFVNEFINQHLRDYQRDGIRFLFSNYLANNGCILADDMGLGKTIQVIGFISGILNKTGYKDDLDNRKPECIRKQLTNVKENKKPFLIACPGSVLYNWINELDVWGYFSVGKYHGNEYKQTLDKIGNNRLDIVITTHETCRDHIDRLENIEWNAVIVDECHKLKEQDSKLTQAFKKFKTKIRIGLSGTILQNNLLEFWCLLDWSNPGCLGDYKSFKIKYATPIECGQKADATTVELFEKINLSNQLKDIKNKYVLRRTKELIADQLPKKMEKIIHCQLTDFQIDIYKQIIKHYKINTEYSEKQKNLCYINLLLKLANHPALLLPKHSCETQSVLTENVFKYVKKKLADDGIDNIELKFENPYNCGKMSVLMKLLKFLNEQNQEVNKIEKAKILLFSYSVKLLDLLQEFLRFEGYSYLRIDGSVNNLKRIELVDKFNVDPNIFIFLISTKAGGVGLNITGANYVIIFDPNWNPSHDLQAADRAYRIGQQRDVNVYRLISSGCIEENIYLRQIDKQLLNKECVENENARRLFNGSKKAKNESEIYGMDNILHLSTDNTCLTKEIFQRNINVEREIAGLSVSNYEAVNKADDIFNDEAENKIENKKITIDNILQDENIVHVHDNKNVTSSSKIEKHLRECIKNKVPSDELASKIKPQLSTLDYIELEEMNELVDNYELENFKGNDVHVIYGSVPENIRRQQFMKMADILNITTCELANKVLKMEKEERYRQLKAYYLKEHPKTTEFYEHFKNKNKLKRERSSLNESQNKRFASLCSESNQCENKVDEQMDKNNSFNDFSIDNLFNEKQKEIDVIYRKNSNDILEDLANENIINKDKNIINDLNVDMEINDLNIVNKSTVDYDKLMDDLFD